jgi:hypothetical protein
MKFVTMLLLTLILAYSTAGQPAGLTSAWESHGPTLPPPGTSPAPHHHHQQYQGPDRTITWRSWQQIPAYGVRIRTGDRYLGGENWEHYLGFELAATSQKVIKVSLIHLDGETAADVELSPRLRDAIVEIVNHHMTARKGTWGWALQEINGPERRGQKVTMEDPAHPRGADSRKSKAA